MRRAIKYKVGFGFLVLSVTVLALSGAFYLGKLYISIVQEGNVPKSTKVTSDGSKSVVARDDSKLLLLNPVPVYFLQAGVYSDLEGAQQGAAPFAKMGYNPYITETAPYKVWIGVYKNRIDTETVKSVLRDKGFGSFTGSLVVNGENLRYGQGNEEFVHAITPLLENYTNWLKENLELFHADRAEKLNWDIVKRQSAVVETVYGQIRSETKIKSNNESVNTRIKSLEDTMGGYKEQLEVLQAEKSPESYFSLQVQMLHFIDNYCILLQEIENISKT